MFLFYYFRHINSVHQIFALGLKNVMHCKIDVDKLYYSLCERKALALGFHVFTSCDVTGKLSGISKEFCFKTLLISISKK